MPTFGYKARDETGKLVHGTMEAHSRYELADKLNRLGYIVTSISVQAKVSAINLKELTSRIKPIPTNDIIMLYIQLSSMISSGLSILVSLETLARQVSNSRLRLILEDICRNVETGATLSESLRKHPQVFPVLYVSMVRAGESSGTLDVVLNRLAKFAEYSADLKNKINAAMTYPIILVVVGVGVITFLVINVLPAFIEVFEQSGVQLPLPTRMLYGLSQVVRRYWYMMIIVFGGLTGLFKFYVSTRFGRLQVDRFKLKIPVVGDLIRKICISRFSRTLSTLVSSGVPILHALEIVEKVVGNEVIARVILHVREGVSEGEKIAQPLRISEEFPPDTIQMIAVGEETGNLEGMLTKIADFYDVSVDYSIKRLTTLIEPVFLLIMGAMVGMIMASIMLPMFDMVKVLKR